MPDPTALLESGFIFGMILGQITGIVLCRWLWINGQKHKRQRIRSEHSEHTDDD